MEGRGTCLYILRAPPVSLPCSAAPPVSAVFSLLSLTRKSAALSPGKDIYERLPGVAVRVIAQKRQSQGIGGVIWLHRNALSSLCRAGIHTFNEARTTSSYNVFFGSVARHYFSLSYPQPWSPRGCYHLCLGNDLGCVKTFVTLTSFVLFTSPNTVLFLMIFSVCVYKSWKCS